MENRKRNTAIALIVFGIIILFGKLLGFFTIVALCMIWFGAHRIRTSRQSSGYILIAIGSLIIISEHLTLIIAILVLSLGLFYWKSKRTHKHATYTQKQSFIQSLRWDREPWVLKHMSIWNVVGEIHMDLSKALPEEKEVTLILQGIVGDVDITVPEDMGLIVHASVLFGQVDIRSEKETGLLNKVIWQSANYETSTQKVKLSLSYIVGDLDIRIL
ncbi:membrane protein [Paenibacillus swuensis]|uniref:Membrane protein n=1 Tax=Paenibacillus swuensis TaxID=1178515 RepID=A0A172TDJ5_9BACL|nr:cell wall-active antibiotics response protein LiaF [Paenibacillus swuensis]ANE45109.1 membrane protein [Paenibacillus swuensis]